MSITRNTAAGLPVVVIGAGPIGLAAAAHLLERGLEPLILEAGERAGAAIDAWQHISLFSPWEYDIDAATRRLLEQTDWQGPNPEEVPTGRDLLERYLHPLAGTPELRARIRFHSEVVAVSRQGVDKTRSIGRDGRAYIVRTHNQGVVTDIIAAAVIDASGTWGQSNPLGAHGLPAPGEADAAAWLSGPLPDVLGRDRERFAGRHTLVVGMGHSAANTLLALVELRETDPTTTISWAIRGPSPERLYGGGADDELPVRGALGTRVRNAVTAGDIRLLTDFTIGAFHRSSNETGQLTVDATTNGFTGSLDVDVVAGATGFRPNLDMLREIQLNLDASVEAPARLAPLIDPNFHSCGTVAPHGASMLTHPDEGFFIVGMKSYGRAPTFLMATGYEQVRSIAAELAGDHAAAERVELTLPQTGVCCVAPGIDVPVTTVGFATGLEHGLAGEATDDACCATPAVAAASINAVSISDVPVSDGCCSPAPALLTISVREPENPVEATTCCEPMVTSR
ncbi:FAD-dependent oxidoreductase [Cryobacterium sp. Y11]|uniref:FAD-dependent oxidoreductase n=1 Tax=Cryobacterium sp. Y11 TaxID=2045016 RepID=UPI000CE31045|nr:FAD-dependent oxidoreductase [Cryobacterium sp. Y11]